MKIRADFVTNSSSSSFVIGFKSDDVRKELEKYERKLPDFDLLVHRCKKRLYKTEEMATPLNAYIDTEMNRADSNNLIDIEYLDMAYDALRHKADDEFRIGKHELDEMIEELRENCTENGKQLLSDKELKDNAYSLLWDKAHHIDPKDVIELARKMKDEFNETMKPYPYMAYFELYDSDTDLEYILRDKKYSKEWFSHH